MRVRVEVLSRKLKGHFGYFGITGNFAALGGIGGSDSGLAQVAGASGGSQGMSWERMNRLLAFFYLPEARVVHSIYAAKP